MGGEIQADGDRYFSNLDTIRTKLGGTHLILLGYGSAVRQFGVVRRFRQFQVYP